MSNKPNQPKSYDLVLGGENPPPINGAVLGGIEGVKRRLESDDIEIKKVALAEALKYNVFGLDLIIDALQDKSDKIQQAAFNLILKSLQHPSVEVQQKALKFIQNQGEERIKLSILFLFQPTNAQEYYQRGLARKNLGDSHGAIADYSEAIKINANYADAYRSRGVIYQELGYLEKANQDFQQVKSIELRLSNKE